MSLATGLAALALIAGPAWADDPAPPPSPAGWTRQATALLLYGADGALLKEIPLPEPENSDAASREIFGGASPDRRLAWTLERRLVWSRGRGKLLESRRQFQLYGDTGAGLWGDASVDVPERGDPTQISADGKVLLLSRREKDGWRAEAHGWLGQTIASMGPFPRLIMMALTPNGRYVLARWNVPDVSDTHAFLDLRTKDRHDVASSDLVLGAASIGDDGVVRSGSKIIYSFEVAASTAPK